MKDNRKFLRVVLGSVVGAALWAGCSTDHRVIREPAGASYDYNYQPYDNPQASRITADAATHPEWRTGWNMAFPNPPSDATRGADLHTAVDQPSLAPPESR